MSHRMSCTFIRVSVCSSVYVYVHNLARQSATTHSCVCCIHNVARQSVKTHSCVYYRLAKTHRIPYLYRSFSAKETYILWLFLWKIICNLGDPMSLRHPVLIQSSSTECKNTMVCVSHTQSRSIKCEDTLLCILYTQRFCSFVYVTHTR